MIKARFKLNTTAITLIALMCAPVFAMQPASDKSMEAVASVEAQEEVVIDDGEVKPFGHWLFGGEFANSGFVGFSPNYVISTGDLINIEMWGGFEAVYQIEVDSQGNIFVPRLGPIKVSGVANSELPELIKRAALRVYTEKVGVYAKVASAQPVKIYVTGFVGKPGLYQGHSSDSPLKFLDMAGGINPDSGSYLNVQLKRVGSVVETYNLYEFLVTGHMPVRSLRDGDVLVVGASKPRVTVEGVVDNQNTFELQGGGESLSRVLGYAGVKANATHVRVGSNKGGESHSRYLQIANAGHVKLVGGEQIKILEDSKVKTFSVRIQGEHSGKHELVVADGMSLGALIQQIEPTEWSDVGGLHLYRQSVKERQKQMLENSLSALEASVMTARSNTTDEAGLRQMEAQMITSWVERARMVEPKGQVVLANSESLDQIMLEPDDVIFVPKKTAIVMVHGDVVSPVASSYKHKMTALEYIELAGGFNQKASNSKILVVSRNGAFTSYEGSQADDVTLSPGDEIMVVPSVATKSLQVGKDLTQVIYQIAVSAGTVLSLVL
ncbi:polysaccharide biosynthesis/export family protein [Vibrio owensii]|uniref:polysaccharide biosynthesis/export family protein n=1 Tax=Vibrio owensii TaxID=696485 RepID=UPI0018F17081|nr:polysaccharide biosynthesis/export family protein [Vibrio owensii]